MDEMDKNEGVGKRKYSMVCKLVGEVGNSAEKVVEEGQNPVINIFV